MAHFLELLAFPLLNGDYFKTETDISLLKQIPSKMTHVCMKEKEEGQLAGFYLLWPGTLKEVDKVIVTVFYQHNDLCSLCKLLIFYM